MIMIKYVHSALVFHISYLNFHRLKKVMKSPTAASEFRCLLCFKCFCRKGGFQKKKKKEVNQNERFVFLEVKVC